MISGFITALKKKGIKLWANDDKIGLFIPKDVSLQDEDKNIIKNNKENILEILHFNKIFSKSDFDKDIIKLSNNKENILSFAQERLWFIERYENGTSAYNVPMVLELQEKVDISVFRKSLEAVVDRHEVLRTVFKQNQAGKDYQLVLNEPLKVREEKIAERKLKQRLIEAATYIFDLTVEYPIKVTFYQTENKNYVLINIHHIAFDGWSVNILLNELKIFYEHLTMKNKLALPELDIQYKDFARWQREYLTDEIFEKQMQYWKELLDGYEPLNFITDRLRPNQINYCGDNFYLELDEELSIKLRKLAQSKETTLYTVLLSGFYILLNKYTGQDDLVIGTPIANRHYTQLEDLIGLFINNLVLRIKLTDRLSVAELICQVHEMLMNAQHNQDLPFEKLVDFLKIEHDSSRHPIFQVLFGTQDFWKEENSLFRTLPQEGYYKIAKFDLSMLVDGSKKEIKIEINYANSLFEKETIERIAKHYVNILKECVREQAQSINVINMLEDEEYRLINKWNKTSQAYLTNKTIVELFEERVEKAANSIALVFKEKEITYKELNEISNKLARHIHSQYKNCTGSEFKPDTLIPICMERSLEMIIGILGILKAGGAYVPIDSEYPIDRIQFILEDINSKLILTQRHLQDKLTETNLNIYKIFAEDIAYIKEDTLNLVGNNSPNNLAYVIYTSGTTGKPKGVLQPHKNVVRLFTTTNEEYRFNEDDVWTLFHSYVFDFTIWELWGALFFGAKLIIPSFDETRDIGKFYDLCEKHGVTVLNQTPLAFYRFIEVALTRKAKLESLRYVIFGGDILNIEQLRPWWDKYGSTKPKMINMYGITETTVHVTYKELSEKDIGKGSNIGKAIKDLKLYVLDKNLKLSPIGVVGELYVGGAGLAQGYLNRPELTKEKFINNPFASEEDKVKGYVRLYKTGDTVRWKTNGDLEYIGRNDFQVKLRGFRIELSEIDNILRSFPGVKQSSVLLKERENSKYLVGYYSSEERLDEEAMQSHLVKFLPEYMVPSTLIYLEKLPITINGKLDRKALPEPDFSLSDTYVAPRNETEIDLCKIWSEVLGLRRIGIKDDFFRIGGDSILSIQLSSKLRSKGYECSIKNIFENRTIERLSHYLKSIINTIKIEAEQGILIGKADLLPIQKWFFEHNFKHKNYWNQSFIAKVPVLEVERLRDIIAKLVEQHDALRLRYRKVRNGYQQFYLKKIAIPQLEILDQSKLSKEELEKVFTKWQNAFDIENGPLWQFSYVYGYEDSSARIYFALHHLIIDSVSWRVLIDDMKSLYEGKKLTRKTSSYRQWAQEVHNYANSHQHELIYWEQQISGQMKNNDFPGIAANKYSGQVVINEELTKLLLQKANYAYHTEINDLLLTALGYALQDWTRKNVNIITLEGHGREEINEKIDVSQTVGWFTTMYPIKLEVKNNIALSIKTIKESLRKIPNKGIGYGALKHSNKKSVMKNHQLPPITFNYLGQFDGSTGLWKIVSENSGQHSDVKNQDGNLVNINGWIVEGKLQFKIDSYLEYTANQQLIESFQHSLEEIIKHCVKMVEVGDIEYTPSDFSTTYISQDLLDRLQNKYEIKAIYPANSLQQGFIYHALSQPGDDAYHIQMVFDYHNELNLQVYREAWDAAITQYPALRTCFNWDEELIQIVCSHSGVIWNEYKIFQEHDQEKFIREIQEEDRRKGFDLRKAELLRIYVIKRSDQRYTVIKSNHHAVSDGWSWPILLNCVHKIYSNIMLGKIISFKEDKAYLLAQEYYSKNKTEITKYWQEKISTIKEVNDLNNLLSTSIDLEQVKKITNPEEEDCIINDEDYKTLKALLQEEGLTMSVLACYAWHKLINSYTSDSQTIVGTTVSGRSLSIDGIENSVGLYINVLPLVIDWSENNDSVLDKLRAIHKAIMELDSHSYVNLGILQKEGKRLFHSLFVFENYPVIDEQNKKNGMLQFEFIRAVEKLDYPLTIMGYEFKNELHFKLKYAGEILDKNQAKIIMSQFEKILKDAAGKLNVKNTNLCLINENEYKKVIFDWNKTDKAYNINQTIVELFEKQVEKTPDAIAVVCNEKQLTYKELNQRANQLARTIRSQYQGQVKEELKSDTPIAIYMDKSIEILISMIGILKANGAYVPIDPEYPEYRIKFILEDINSTLVLTKSHFLDKLKNINDNIYLIELDKESYYAESIDNLPIQTNSKDLAYIIYTSGTTGKPKGVMIEHSSVINYIENIHAKLLPGRKKVDFSSSLGFDLTVTTTLGSLLLGNSIYIYTGRLDDIRGYVQHLEKNQIQLIKTVPILYELISRELLSRAVLTEVILGGEKLNRKNLNYHHSIRIYDEYGPTETTVGALLSTIYPDKQPGIGKAYDNYRLYILDANLQPVPIGMIGELYIGGAGLARGYFNRPDLTGERFILNPFVTEEDKAMGYNKFYKTGDLVKWLSDGNIEYIGRNDFQVKLRGFRIELGEIENTLSSFPGIKQSVVLMKGREESKYLVGYYVSDWVEEDDSIKSYLEDFLPEYMVPSVYIHLKNLPLTTNGKVDREALPSPELSSDNIYIAPRDNLEAKLCTLWAEILSLPRVGITDDFFKIGGSSILAIKVIHKINHALNMNVTIATLFSCKTIDKLKDKLLNQVEKIQVESLSTDKSVLSYAQERLWFIERYEGGTNAYNVPITLGLEEKVNIVSFKKSLSSIVERHEILRTIFEQDELGVDYQVVLKKPLIIQEIIISEDEIKKILEEDSHYIFDLTIEYPIRVKLYQTEQKRYILINIHHVAFDGWSVDILLKEIKVFYEYFEDTRELALPNLDIQYKDFASWQRQYLTGDVLEKQVRYWKEALTGYEPLNLMVDKIRPRQIDYKGDNFYFEINIDISNKLRKLAQAKGTTLYTVLLTGFYILLNKYTRQNDLVIGTPIANRHYVQLENLIGFFINSLALRVQIKEGQNVEDLINQVHEMMINAQLHQDLPFEKLVDVLKVGQDSSRHPIFQVIFAVQSFGTQKIGKELFKFLPIGENYKVAKFDLTVIIDDSQEKFKGVMNYALSLYEKSTIERFFKHYLCVLEQMVKSKKINIEELTILSEKEYQQIVFEWNKTDENYLDNKTLVMLFEEQTAKTPNSIAIVFGDKKLTYQELNDKSNQLAWHIRAEYKKYIDKDLKPDTLIAMYVERSLETVIGILAIIKSGGAYVPIGADYPEDRIQFILEDCGSQIILTQSHLQEKLKSVNNKVHLIVLDQEPYNNFDTANLPSQNSPQDLVYVLYTSGTTGKPKGVMQSHSNVMRLFTATEAEYKFNENDVWILFHSYIFDLTVWELWGAFLYGAKLVIPSYEETRDTAQFYDSCAKHQVTVLTQTPLAFYRFIEEALTRNDKLESLRYVVFGGDILQFEKLKPWWNHYGYKPKLINMYGITETTVHVTYKELSNKDIEFGSNMVGSNVGRAIRDQKVYVLDEGMNVVPIGVPGEIYVGGAGLARGYLNRPELTKERFIPNPFITDKEKLKGHTRLYKSGDIARWNENGELEYIGRNDFQVKIRGFRVELGEVENTLNKFPDIKQSVVLVKERNETKYLVGYYVSEYKLNEEKIYMHMSERLSEYMIPNILVYLEKLPLTINGKLDRKALPDPDFSLNETYIIPRDEIEIELYKIWVEVLKIDKIGIKDDFFRIGGDSILSIQLISRLRSHGYECNIRSIFENRTIERLGNYLKSEKRLIKTEAEQGILIGKFHLLPIQQWFFDRKFPEENYWNQSFLVKVPVLDIGRLQNILPKLVSHHDVLRIQYQTKNEVHTQSYLAKIRIPKLKVLDRSKFSESEFEVWLTKWQCDFDISNGPLWQVGYIHGYEDGSARIYFALHHLIIDSVSWRILIEDLKSLYEGKSLRKKTSSYRQWVEIVRKYDTDNIAELIFWQDIIEGGVKNYPAVGIEIQQQVVTFSADMTKDLLQRANSAYHTEINDLLLTGLGYALQSWTGDKQNHIILESHGRENIDEKIDLSQTVGWFTTMYPVKLDLKEDLSGSIKSIKEGLREIPNKGIGYGAFKYSEKNNILSSHKLPPISFNYLGQFDRQEGLWQVVDENSGISVGNSNRHELLLNINGWVVNGKLQFSVESKLKINMTKKFVEYFRFSLEKIVRHCIDKVEKNEIEYTLSDFSVNEDTINLVNFDMENDLLHFEEETFHGN